MDLEKIMGMKNFVIVGDTLNEDKYAYKIKHKMEENGYNVSAVGKELTSINEVKGDIDVIDMCIHPAKGIAILRENKKPYKSVVIQPGAESDEIREFLKENNIPFVESCLLVGLSLYK